MEITVTTSDDFDARAKQAGLEPAALVTQLLDQLAKDHAPRLRSANIRAAGKGRAVAARALRVDAKPKPSPAVPVKPAKG